MCVVIGGMRVIHLMQSDGMGYDMHIKSIPFAILVRDRDAMGWDGMQCVVIG